MINIAEDIQYRLVFLSTAEDVQYAAKSNLSTAESHYQTCSTGVENYGFLEMKGPTEIYSKEIHIILPVT